MPTSDPTQILLTHNRWANQQIIDACRELSDEQFHQSFEMGVGSLHNSLNHIMGAMKGWGDLLGGREQQERLESQTHSIDELEVFNNDLSDDLENSAAANPVDQIVTGERGGQSYSFARGAVLTHVTTHGMHHRAQCLNMLRQLGVEKLPPSAVVEWIFMVDNNR